jgi:predicted metal-binding membrane protein
MLLLLALGVMSIGWMATVAVLALAQKLLPPRAAVDIPLAIAFVALGAVIITIPSSIPGLVPSM